MQWLFEMMGHSIKPFQNLEWNFKTGHLTYTYEGHQYLVKFEDGRLLVVLRRRAGDAF